MARAVALHAGGEVTKGDAAAAGDDQHGGAQELAVPGRSAEVAVVAEVFHVREQDGGAVGPLQGIEELAEPLLEFIQREIQHGRASHLNSPFLDAGAAQPRRRALQGHLVFTKRNSQ